MRRQESNLYPLPPNKHDRYMRWVLPGAAVVGAMSGASLVSLLEQVCPTLSAGGAARSLMPAGNMVAIYALMDSYYRGSHFGSWVGVIASGLTSGALLLLCRGSRCPAGRGEEGASGGISSVSADSAREAGSPPHPCGPSPGPWYRRRWVKVGGWILLLLFMAFGCFLTYEGVAQVDGRFASLDPLETARLLRAAHRMGFRGALARGLLIYVSGLGAFGLSYIWKMSTRQQESD